ncbi:hypothetical protein BKP56_09145 [Marinilactibacillus sp. 15R]|uniref:hypothetical protein n=1 Tax=Marinilactibacillus sp. 15R TaxID=1911586 RepID=UPI00090A5E56|nr:hypothetical protein [Marinilactibacillus sp. 15R]API89409.1 hypothetical protein BKP56_09145 [Marinilactibacillus sp. 15R]
MSREYMKIYVVNGHRKNCIVTAANGKEAAVKPDEILLRHIGKDNLDLIGVYDYHENGKGKINYLETIVEEAIRRHNNGADNLIKDMPVDQKKEKANDNYIQRR